MDSLKFLQKENARLTAENKRLRSLLMQHGIHVEAPTPVNLAKERLALYRQYFRGREDVYAQHWYNKEGKKQYSPMVIRAYRFAGKAAQEAAKKRGEQIYENFDDEALTRHLSRDRGDQSHSYGLYLIVNDDECYVAAIDFDGPKWEEDIKATIAVIEEYRFPFLIECSQSGNGAHLWFFFIDAIKARKARQFCSSLITLTMEYYPLSSMQSYDRIYPSQDRVTTDGFGSLIALPLEGEARSVGRTVFLDQNLCVFDDPWSALKDLDKIAESDIGTFLTGLGPQFDAGKMGFNTPQIEDSSLKVQQKPTAPESDHHIELILREGVSFPIADLVPSLVNELKRIASFHNPEFYKAQKLRLSTWNKPRIITCAELDEGIMTLPRGCLTQALSAFQQAGVTTSLLDERNEGESFPLTFRGTLRQEQQRVVDEMRAHVCGVLSAPTGFGKTAVAAALVAALTRNTLIIVHTRPLLQQWRRRLKEFLDTDVGVLGGGKNTITGRLDVALINSLAQEQHQKVVDSYGVVIVDECHHVAAVSYEQVLKRVRAKHVYGLTATPIRSDGHHDIIFMQCGPLISQIDQKLWREKCELDGQVITRFTAFRCDYQHLGIQEIYDALSQDEERNSLITSDIERHSQEGRSILVLSNRLAQLTLIEKLLHQRGIASQIVSGSQSARKRREVEQYLDELKATHRSALILSTATYIGEGFDLPSLDTLVIASPVAWKGSITQYTGRVSRQHEGKEDVLVLDYVDFKIPVLTRMFSKRARAFKNLGFRITQFGQKPDDDLLYTDLTYWEVLERDLRQTKGPILIATSFVSQGRVRRLLPLLQELSQTKEISVMISNEEDATLFTKQGFVALVIDDVVNCILIGGRILWYGSINIFGTVRETDTLLRIEDPTYVADVKRWLDPEVKNLV